MAKISVVIGHSHSLKDKRMVIRRMKDRVRERLGVSIAEIGELDTWQRAELGVAVASGDRGKALALIDEVVGVIAKAGGGDVVAVAKDAWTFDAEPVPQAMVDDRTGSGDKASSGLDGWVPDAWKEQP